MDNTRYIPTNLREYIFIRDRYTCRYCGDKKGPFEIDHVFPFSRGGPTIRENLVTACDRCNGAKSSHVGIWPMPIGYSKTSNDSVILAWVYMLVSLAMFTLPLGIIPPFEFMYGKLPLPMFIVGIFFNMLSLYKAAKFLR